MIFSFAFSLRVKDEVIVQPFSSKVSRMVLAQLYPHYLKSTDSPGLKPHRVTALRDRRPLFSTGKNVLRLSPGKEYSFYLTSLEQVLAEEVLKNPSGTAKVYHTEGKVELNQVKYVQVESLALEDSRTYVVRFLTPTLLQPPRPSFKRRRNRYVLFPYSPLLLTSLAVHWNAFSHVKVNGVGGLRALYYFREVGYNLTPITVPYEQGTVRGFVGWTKFSLDARRSSGFREKVRTLLGYGNFMGVGKSRSIGFGEIEAFPWRARGEGEETDRT